MRSLSARTQRGEGDVDALRAARATGSARPSRRFPNPPATAVIDSCSLHQTRGESCTSRVAASTRSWRIRPHPVQPSSSPAPAAEQVPLPSPSTPLVQRLGLRSRSQSSHALPCGEMICQFVCCSRLLRLSGGEFWLLACYGNLIEMEMLSILVYSQFDCRLHRFSRC